MLSLRSALAAAGAAVLVAAGGGLVVASAASAATADAGYADQTFSGLSNPPTADKPQSKLWYTGGSWWADMFDSPSGTWHIFRLDRSRETWVDTGTQLDDRSNTHADALWDGSKLYVASHVVTVSSDAGSTASIAAQARLYRYSFTGSGFTLDTGFPATISNSSSESLTIDKDSRGALWATWTQVAKTSTGYTNTVYVNNTNGNDSSWGSPFAVPVLGNHPAPDDISAVVSYGKSRIGVMWSNQLNHTVYWAMHKDGAGRTAWSVGAALRGKNQADDHLNLKTIQADTQGRVVAAVKTSADLGGVATDAQIDLLVFKPGTAVWTVSTVGTVADCQTRPIVMLDDEHSVVHVLMTAPSSPGCPWSGYAGTIYDKTASLDNPVFAAGRGTPIIEDSSSDNMNDPTSSKQSVNGTTGLVVLASDTNTGRYWHADLSLGPPSPSPGPSPSASPSPSPSPSPSASPSPAATGGGVVVVAGRTTASSAAATVVGLTKPAGASAGDLLVASFTSDMAPAVSAPAGWTSLLPVLQPGGGQASLFAYYRVLTSADAASGSWTWTLGSAQKWNGGVTWFTGVDAAHPLDSAVSTAVTDNWAATSITVPGVTTATAGALVIGGYGADGKDVTVAQPAGFSETWESATQQIAEQAALSVPNPGSTGSRTWTLDQGRAQAAWLVALRPA